MDNNNSILQTDKAMLMRTLGISEEKIAALEAGEAELAEVLQARITESMQDPSDTTQCAIICQNIKFDGCTYETLDPSIYFKRILELKAKGGSFIHPVSGKKQSATVEQENQPSNNSRSPEFNRNPGINFGISINPNESVQEIPIYPHPVRRFIARGLDQILCLLVVNCIYRLIVGIDPYMYTMTGNSSSTAWVYIIYILMLAVEPLFISAFATTPGKFIMGIRITAANGQKLSIGQAYLRTLRLWHHGFGFLIPIYNLIRMGIACSACRRGLPLPWDYGTVITRKESMIPARLILLLLLIFTLSSVDAALSSVIAMPPNRGDITEEQFYENCTYIYKYNGINVSTPFSYEPTTDSRGFVNSVSFTVEEDKADTITEYYYQMHIAFLALAGASKSASAIELSVGSVNDYFSNCFSDFTFNYGGYTITNKVTCKGYTRNIIYGYMYKTGNDDHYYKQVYTISR